MAVAQGRFSMKLAVPDYVILIVEDLDRALRFYTDVLELRLGHRTRSGS